VYFLILLLLEYTGDGGSGGTLGRVLRSTHAALDRMRLGWFGIKIDDGQLALSSEQGMISVPLDEDAERERAYVRNTPNLELLAPVVIKDIWKAYPPPAGCSRNRKPRLAVRGLSAAIRKGETFGLLGSNVSDGCLSRKQSIVIRSSIASLTFVTQPFFIHRELESQQRWEC
jgi:hypothetical protein